MATKKLEKFFENIKINFLTSQYCSWTREKNFGTKRKRFRLTFERADAVNLQLFVYLCSDQFQLFAGDWKKQSNCFDLLNYEPIILACCWNTSHRCLTLQIACASIQFVVAASDIDFLGLHRHSHKYCIKALSLQLCRLFTSNDVIASRRF